LAQEQLPPIIHYVLWPERDRPAKFIIRGGIHSMKKCRIQLFAAVIFFVTGNLYGQNPKVVLFETFTNSYSECPNNDAFDAAFKATLAADGSKIIHLNYHIINYQDPMALASIPSSDSVMSLLSGQTGPSLPILCGAVDRVNFPQYHKLTGTIPGGKTQWDNQIAADLKLNAPVAITLASAQIDTLSSTKSSRLIAKVDVTSTQPIADSMGLHFVVTQDNVPYAQCPSVPGPTTHNNVVRYITMGDSALALKGNPSGTLSHVTYVLDISKTKPNFSLADMKLIGFVEDRTAGDFTVAQAALLQTNLGNLPPPPASITLNTSTFEGKTFAPGDPITILFDKVSIAIVKLEYSLDNGATWNVIDTTHEFSYFWYAPTANTTQAKIRISESQTDNPISTETGTFSIKNTQPSIKIIHPSAINPTALDTAVAGKIFSIVWNSYLADTVKISYSVDGTNWGIIRPSLIGAKSYNWNLLGIKATPTAQIKIEGLGDASNVVSISDPFPIVNSAGVSRPAAQIFSISVNPQPLHRSQQLKANIKLDSYYGIEVSMYDLGGKKVYSKERMSLGAGENTITLETGLLPAGTYLLEVRRDDGQVRMVKVVVE
jgi:hypothetical protein